MGTQKPVRKKYPVFILPMGEEKKGIKVFERTSIFLTGALN
jgi:hypothetical protein